MVSQSVKIEKRFEEMRGGAPGFSTSPELEEVIEDGFWDTDAISCKIKLCFSILIDAIRFRFYTMTK